MNSRGSISVLLLVGVGSALAAVHCTPSPAKAPVQRFPHRVHLVKTKVDCYTCHASISSSNAIDGFTSPGYAPCAKCHGKQAGPQGRFTFDPAQTFVAEPGPRHVLFSHQDHREVTSGQCARCHAAVQTDETTRDILPSMQTCLASCHQQAYAEGNCTLCHRTADLVRLRPETDIPHGQDYVPRHQTDAARARNLCSACHSANHCTSCHDTSAGLRGDRRNLDAVHGNYPHEGDFVTRHAIEARTSPSSCMRCHEPSSCDSCHANNRVSGNAIGAINPHPTGWGGGDPGNPEFHGRAARRRALECASCHEQGPATNCIRCHKVGAFGGNPHPSGWRGSRSRGSDSPCQYCHTR